MKKHIYILFAFLIFISCSDNDDEPLEACGTIEPTKNLAWLKSEITDREAGSSDLSKYFYISQGTYNSQTVFVLDDCCPTCNTVVLALDCDGNVVGQINADIQRNEIKNPTIIYKPQNFACQTN